MDSLYASCKVGKMLGSYCTEYTVHCCILLYTAVHCTLHSAVHCKMYTVHYTLHQVAEEVLGWKSVRSLGQMCSDMWNWQTKNPQGFAGTQ